MATATKNTVRATYTLVVKDSKGKVTDTREVVRNSQWSAHSAARGFFANWDRPAGTTMDMMVNGKAIEHFTMDKNGWDFEVLNGDSVNAASRAARTKVAASKAKATVTNKASAKAIAAERVAKKATRKTAAKRVAA